MLIRKPILTLLFIPLMSITIAKTYICIDVDGNKMYTNNKSEYSTCSVELVGTLNTYSSHYTPKKKSYRSKNNKNPANVVGSNMLIPKRIQSHRDLIRKQILTEEFNNEKQAKQAILNKIYTHHTKSNNNPAMQQLKKQAAEHQHNMDVISKELTRI